MAAKSVVAFLTIGLVALAGLAQVAEAGEMEVASSDCQAAANRVVSKTGGQLLSVSMASHDGQTVCKVTVLVQGSSKKRPRKMTVTVPQ